MAEGLSSIAGYVQSDTDQSSSTTQYFGFQGGNGIWYIAQVISVGGVSTTYRYIAGGGGTSTYTTNWTNRASLSYDYYGNIFQNF